MATNKGGKLVGASHAEGGIDIITPNGKIEAEGGEIIITKKASEEHCETLSKINQSGGGIAIPCDNNSKQPKKADNGAIISHLTGEHKEAYAMAERILAEESVSKNKLTILTAWKKSLLPHFYEEENKIYNYRRDAGAKHFIAEHQKFKKLIAKIIKSTVKKEDIIEFANLLKHHIKEEEIYFTKMDEPMKAASGTKISSATTNELDKAVSDLHRVERAQKMMKEANAIIRSKKNVQERLVKEAGFSETEAENLLKGDFRGRVGFSSYALTNNNANLKRLQDRVKMLQKKVEGAKAAATGGAEKYSFENGFFEVNYEADRVQIFFEGMPTAQQKNDLKRNGWHWSYTNKAWQRKITPQAIRNAEYLLKATKIVKIEPEAKTESNPSENAYGGFSKLAFVEGEEHTQAQKIAIEIVNSFITDYEKGLDKPTVELGNKNHTVEINFKPQSIMVVVDDNKSPIAAGILISKNGSIVEEYKLSDLNKAIAKLKMFWKERETLFENEFGSEFMDSETKGTKETVTLPNTPEEFDEVILSNVNPEPGWGLSIVKQGNIRRQILEQLTGGTEEEKLIEAQRLFEKFKIKHVSGTSSSERINYEYKNQYELNKSIEVFITEKGDSPSDYTSDEKNWIRKYSGYGGLDKYGTTGKGGLFEYYTPKDVIEKMWALAYKYGYNNGPVLEPSVATGEFLQFAKPETRVVGYEISQYSAQICKILYPNAEILRMPFEEHFIKNNWTMKDSLGSLEKFDLVIGNPPYGDFSIVASRYMTGMGEKDHTKAKNYVEYFIRRGLDLLNPKGLLIFIVGAQVKNGGTLFLDSGLTPVKEYLQKNCELLDAYRLPDSIFERTGVTSEIIVLQKN